MRKPLDAARGWVTTEPSVCLEDVQRLGLDEAAKYNLDLIAEQTADGDDTWKDATLEALREALREIA